MSKTITSVSEKLEALDEAMFELQEAIGNLKACGDDDDFRIWAETLQDMHRDMEKRQEELDRDEYAANQEYIYEMTREWQRGLI